MTNFTSVLRKNLRYIPLFFIIGVCVYSIWYVKTWSSRLEAFATQTIALPTTAHDVVEIQGLDFGDDLVVKLVMSGPITVVTQSYDDSEQYYAFKAGSGNVCDGPTALYMLGFVLWGFDDQCLVKHPIDAPENALVLRVVREHRFRRSLLAGLFLSAGRDPDPIENMGRDRAWVLEMVERVNGTETLLGRAVATELPSDEYKYKTEFHFWPDFPELKRGWQDDLLKPLTDEEIHQQWRFFIPSPWFSYGLYYPVDLLSYALLERTMGVRLGHFWKEAGKPLDLLEALDYSEELIFSTSQDERRMGEAILYKALGFVSSRHFSDEDTKRIVMNRAKSIGLKVLELPADEVDHSMVHRFILHTLDQAGRHADFQELMIKLAEQAFVTPGGSGGDALHQAQRYFSKMTSPFPKYICDAGRDRLEKYERKYDGKYTLCD